MSFNIKDAEPSAPPGEPRQQLLEAAAEIFARSGFRTATVREICQRAGANIAAVNYHFGDKETLYAEVLSHALQQARRKYPPDLGLGPKATPEERLYAFVHSFLLRIFDTGPHAYHAKLMAREMVEPTSALDRLVREEIGPMAGTLMTIVRSLLSRTASDEQVRRCGMSVVSQILFYHHCRPVVTRLFPDMKFSQKEIEQIAQHITRFSLGALREMAKGKAK